MTVAHLPPKLGEFVVRDRVYAHKWGNTIKFIGPNGPGFALLPFPDVLGAPTAKDALAQQVNYLVALEHVPCLLATQGAVERDGGVLVFVEPVEGTLLSDLLTKRGTGFGTRGSAGLIAQVTGALLATGAVHGTITADSIVIGRDGRPRLLDLALGPPSAFAARAGVLGEVGIAPEIRHGSGFGPRSDVYGVGALLYACLVGKPLVEGGPRPSDVVPGLLPEIDQVIARACHRDPDERFASVASLREMLIDLMGEGVASLDAPRAATAPMRAMTGPIELPDDPALAAALADTNEKWLITKGNVDFGPFALAAVIEQIRSGDIVAGHLLMDKDSGARMAVEEHPQLAGMVEAARRERDDARRAKAEADHAKKHKKTNAALYGGIGVGILLVALATGLWIRRAGDAATDVAGVGALKEAELQVTLSAPKKPPKKVKQGGGSNGSAAGKTRAGGGGPLGSDDDVDTLDLSDDSEGGDETLDMDTIFAVYSKRGSALGRCLGGSGSATVSIVIDGPTGKVTSCKVNDSRTGQLAECITSVMRGLSFPAVNGRRTRAEFEISL